MKRGFTLVELSIVLVVIGLLIGGVLVAQSMINSTRLQSLVRQIGQFDAAVVNFTTRFINLPGDHPSICTTAQLTTDGRGDRDGLIESRGGGVPTFSGEIGTFWNALSLTGFSTGGLGTNGTTFVQSSAIATSIVLAGTGAHIPKSAAGAKNASIIAFNDGTNNWYGIISTDQYTASAFVDSTATNSALKPGDAAAVDAKIDDGIANSGNVRGGATSVTGPSTTIDADCGAGTAYTTATTTEACNLAIRIGSQTGTAN